MNIVLIAGKKFFGFFIRHPPGRPYDDGVLSDKGPLPRSDPRAGRARAVRTGAPRDGRQAGDEGGAPGGAAPYVIGRARLASSAARGGRVTPPQKGASQALWRLPPLHRPRNLAGATGKPRTQRAAGLPKLGCLKCESELGRSACGNILPLIRRLDPPARPEPLRRGEGPGIHPSFRSSSKRLDARVTPAHDERGVVTAAALQRTAPRRATP